MLKKEHIPQILQDANASWFDLETQAENEENPYFLLTTRQHGDVGEETPGSEDILAGRRILQTVKSQFPNTKCEVEYVDEWTHVTLTPT